VPVPGARDRHLHMFTMVATTPDRFPRRAGMARKRPLGATRAHLGAREMEGGPAA
jgi:hypothetical protein